MKIPPRTMFMAQVSSISPIMTYVSFLLKSRHLVLLYRVTYKLLQTWQVVGTSIAAFVYIGTAWWLMETIPNICNTELLPSDSPWTCPGDHVFYDASVTWGLISPRRIFGDLGTYSALNWFFLCGAIAPLLVWFAHKTFPGQNWILLIKTPVLIGATFQMPPATAVNYTTWILVGFLSSYVVYRYRRDWWERHNYLLSGALDAGLAFMAVLIYLCLGLEDISLNWWGNDLDGCPLASCPTAKGIVVKGCAVYTWGSPIASCPTATVLPRPPWVQANMIRSNLTLVIYKHQ